MSGFISETDGKTATYSLEQRKNLIFYSSQLTNNISSFPKFSNDAINREVLHLKDNIKDYIAAIEAFNINDVDISEEKFEKSYKKLQHLRRFLKSDEDEVLNRYLVRIKINMSNLNSNLSHDLPSTS